jgi:hypothetical protein
MPLAPGPLCTRLCNKSTHANPQTEVNENDDNKTDRDNSRTPALVVNALDIAALADLVNTPDIQEETVD